MGLDVAAAHFVARQQLHHASDGQITQYEPTQLNHLRIIEHNTLARVGIKLQPFDPIIGRELQTLAVAHETQGGSLVEPGQRLTGQQTKCRHVRDRCRYDDISHAPIGNGRLQLNNGGNLVLVRAHGSYPNPSGSINHPC